MDFLPSDETEESSNCTFMELKLQIIEIVVSVITF